MSDPSREEIERLYHELSALSESDADARLSQLDDPRIRDEVRSLLRHARDAGSFLEPPTAPVGPPSRAVPAASSATVRVGTTIGPYRILDELGSGGFGVVYLAEQREPVRRRVGLKIIKLGMDTEEVLQRFELERRALALMDHPNVARVLDAGATPEGRPYFAMEYVRGVPITDFAESQQLSTRERLELFIPICDAVQHAHQKGIIHRDLKPSNILVTLIDDRATPKVIDFGIAKAVDQHVSDLSHFTRQGQFWGTVEYASPEQVENSPLGVDTRSDVYSLGVVLYQLLTGHLPFDSATLRAGGHDEVRRILREVAPPKPSVRTASGPTGGANPLTKTLRGDLDWIVLRAMDKERARRYETASALADDIRRFLRSEPVSAGPPSVSYRIKKFARRHRLGVTIAAGVAAALMTSAVVTAWQWQRAETALGESEDRYQQILTLSGSYIDELDRSLAGLPGSTAARKAGAVAGVSLLKELSDTVRPTAELHSSLLDAYGRLARTLEHAEAPASDREAVYRDALEVAARSPAPTPRIRTRAIVGRLEAGLGLALLDIDGVTAAMPWIDAAQARIASLDEHDLDPDALAEVSMITDAAARVAYRAGSQEEARRLHDRAILLLRQAHAQRDHDLSLVAELTEVILRAARFSIDVGRLGRAAELASNAIDTAEASQGPGSTKDLERALARAYQVRGYALDSDGRVNEALRDYANAAEIAERLWTDDRLDAAAWDLLNLAYDNRADVLYREERFEEAVEMYRVFVAKSEAALAADPLRADRRFAAALAREKLGDALRESESFEDAEERYVRALEVYRDLDSESGNDRRTMIAIARVEHHLAKTRWSLGARERARIGCERSVAMYARAQSLAPLNLTDQTDYSLVLRFLGYARLGQGDWSNARDSLHSALDTSWPGDPKRHKVIAALATCLVELGAEDVARTLAIRGLAELELIDHPDREDLSLRDTLRALAGLEDSGTGGAQ